MSRNPSKLVTAAERAMAHLAKVRFKDPHSQREYCRQLDTLNLAIDQLERREDADMSAVAQAIRFERAQAAAATLALTAANAEIDQLKAQLAAVPPGLDADDQAELDKVAGEMAAADAANATPPA